MTEPSARPILTLADLVEARERLLRLGYILADVVPPGETRYISPEDGRWLLGLADFITATLPQFREGAPR